MAATGATGDFALDVQSIAKLKYSARKSPQEGLKQTAKQFEALFLQRVLKQMRAAIPKSGLLHSQQSDMYDSMMDQQWAQTLAKRGIGLADVLTRQLQGKIPGQAADAQATAAADVVGGIPVAAPQALQASEPIRPHKHAKAAENTPLVNDSGDSPRVPLMAARRTTGPLFGVTDADQTAVAATDAAASPHSLGRQMLPGYVQGFLDRMDSAANTASRETGIPKRLILAQAALETGWGQHEVTRADGRPSFNVFNVKAAGWQGDSTRVSTREFEHGRAQHTQADFRVYDSYEDAFSDYARLLTQSPRYQPVVNAPTAAAAARQLQVCGYATDPKYADKLVSIMSRIPDNGTQVDATAALFGSPARKPEADQTEGDQAKAFITAIENAVAVGNDNRDMRLAKANSASSAVAQLF